MQKNFLQTLNAPDYASFMRNVEQPASGTLNWFLAESTFTAFMAEDKSTLLSVRGSPGQGKTILSKFLLDYLEREYSHGSDRKNVMVLYFFFYDQDRNLRTVNSLLRSLVDQLYRAPEFNTPLADFEEYTKAIGSNDALWTIFESSVNGSNVDTIYIVLDGLDECEEGFGRTRLLRRMNDLLLGRKWPAVKILITTRPITSILDEIGRFPYFDLKAHTEDLKIFVGKKIAALPERFSSDFRNRAAELLLEKAGNTFLWISIAMKKLQSLKWPNIAGLERTVDRISTDLDILYRDIFRQILEGPEEMQKVVMWVAYVHRPLTLDELGAAIATQLDSKNEESTRNYRVSLTMNTLTAVAGIVLECMDDWTVHLIHQSAKDFIRQNGLLLGLQFGRGLSPDIYIAKTCMVYLAFDDFKHARLSHQVGSPTIQETKRCYPLLDYAANNWHAHIHDERYNPQYSEVLFQIIEPTSSKLYLWVQVAGILDKNTPAGQHPLILATKANIEWLALYILSHQDERITVTQEALDYALSIGPPPIAKAALKSAGSESNAKALESVTRNAGASRRVIREGVLSAQTVTAQAVKNAAKNWVKGDELMEELTESESVKLGEGSVEAVAQFFGQEVLRSILRRHPGIQITKRIIVAAAKNQQSGPGNMKELLKYSNNVQVDAELIREVVKNNICRQEIIGVFVDSDKIHFMEDAVVVVINALHVDVVQLVFSRMNFAVTEKIFVAVVQMKGNTKILELLLARNADIRITEAVVAAAAGNELGEEVMKLLLARDSNVVITEAVMTAAAGNKRYGKEVLKLLLAGDSNVEITEAVMTAAAGNEQGKEVMELLLARDANVKITEAVMTAAAGNKRYGKEVLTLLLAGDSNVEITEAVMTAAVGNERDGKDIMELLLARDANVEITEAVITAAVGNKRYGKEVLKLLLAGDSNVEITEAVMTAAAGNERDGKEVMELLLAGDSNVEITEAPVTAAARNTSSGKEVMELLLARDANVEITEAVMTAAAGNEQGKEVMKLLLTRDPNVEITHAVLTAAAWSGKEVMELLLARDSNIKITGAAVTAVAGSLWGKEVMELLLARDPNVEVTEAVMTAAAGNKQGKEVMELLLARDPNVEITEAVMTAAARNMWGKEVMELLLARDLNVEVTEAVMTTAAQNMWGKEVMELLLARDANVEITEAVMTAAAGNIMMRGKEVMELLLARDPNVEITEAVMTAAAGNEQGKEVMELLLTRDPSVEITEAVMTAAAGTMWGKQVMELLLARDPNVEINEAVMTAAAGNEQGEDVMELLLARDSNVEITEAVMTAAAGNMCGKEVMELLLARDPNVEITEAVMTTAAGNMWGKEVMELLLARYPNIEITEAVMTAAAGNQRGNEVMELLLARGSNTEITEAVMTAAAGNKRGKEVMELLLASDSNIKITAAVMTAAAGNMWGKEVMELLLARDPNVEITEAVMTAAARNEQGKEVMELLLARDPMSRSLAHSAPPRA
jgi:predicted acetyltransferase